MKKKKDDNNKYVLDNNDDEVVTNMDDLRIIFISCYKNSPLYRKKLCWEHFDCFVPKWTNARSDIISTLLKETNTNMYRPLVWIDMYASLQSNGVLSSNKDVEYKWNCIDEMPSGKYWLH